MWRLPLRVVVALLLAAGAGGCVEDERGEDSFLKDSIRDAPRSFEITRAGVPPIRLGMTMAEVSADMGEPAERDRDYLGFTRWFWFSNAFSVTFDRAGRVGEISLVHDERGFRVSYRGVDLLHAPAKEVVRELNKISPGQQREGGFSYVFPALRLSLWREVLPGEEDVEFRDGLYWETVTTHSRSFAAEARAAAARRRAADRPIR